MIKLNKLSKSFCDHKVLDGVDLEIPDGQALAVIGPSGCGKSTLLKLLIRLEEPTGGSVTVNGRDIAKLDEEGLIGLRQKVGMIFQYGALFDSLSVYENVAFALREHAKLPEREIARVVKEKLRLVEMEGTEKLMPEELSGGMQKRVGIARALAFNPTIILYDEPTTGLDPITSVTIENLMVKLARELKVTSVLVTHVMQTVQRVANRVVMMNEGKFIELGSPAEAARSNEPIVKRFITGGV
ncbi:MAG: ABC transporter ATP-binding protein [Candidatus Margulisiibacteriota bacterium]